MSQITPEDITRAPQEPLGSRLPTEGQGYDPITGVPDRYSQELGYLGRFWGGAHEKSGNIAGFVVVISAIIILGGVVDYTLCSDKEKLSFIGTIISSAFSAMSGALGYIFGSNNKKDN